MVTAYVDIRDSIQRVPSRWCGVGGGRNGPLSSSTFSQGKDLLPMTKRHRRAPKRPF